MICQIPTAPMLTASLMGRARAPVMPSRSRYANNNSPISLPAELSTSQVYSCNAPCVQHLTEGLRLSSHPQGAAQLANGVPASLVSQARPTKDASGSQAPTQMGATTDRMQNGASASLQPAADAHVTVTAQCQHLSAQPAMVTSHSLEVCEHMPQILMLQSPCSHKGDLISCHGLGTGLT